MDFEQEYQRFLRDFGVGRTMVLSTSLNDKPTSRMMSVVLIGGKFYFQTDTAFRKYAQIAQNPNVALCIDNMQVEGQCEELGHPAGHADFCAAYRERFPSSFARYSSLDRESVFAVSPTYIECWKYIGGVPYMETFDVTGRKYGLEEYHGSV